MCNPRVAVAQQVAHQNHTRKAIHTSPPYPPTLCLDYVTILKGRSRNRQIINLLPVGVKYLDSISSTHENPLNHPVSSSSSTKDLTTSKHQVAPTRSPPLVARWPRDLSPKPPQSTRDPPRAPAPWRRPPAWPCAWRAAPSSARDGAILWPRRRSPRLGRPIGSRT